MLSLVVPFTDRSIEQVVNTPTKAVHTQYGETVGYVTGDVR